MDERRVTVGIFMPAYNQGEYVGEAIDSLKRQTFQDFFVHIVDDGSDDGITPERLDNIHYKKAKIFHNSVNKGVSFRAREHYKLLNAKYILVLCADDLLAPTFLEKVVKRIEKNPKCGIVSTNIYVFSDDSKSIVELDKHKMTLPFMLSRCYCFGSSLMRKEALENLDFSGGFNKYQDWDRYTTMIENGWEADLIQEPLFYYRQLPDSLSHSLSRDEEVEIRKKMLKKHKKYYEKYYETVIVDMQYHFSEMRIAKDWLDRQYRSLNNKIDELNKKIEEQNNTIESITKERDRLRKRLNKDTFANRVIVRIIKNGKKGKDEKNS